MFLYYNEDNLQALGLVITDDMTKNYCEFMNFLMAEIYDIFFQERLPRVLPKMKEVLQLSHSKMIGDWFLTEFGTIIRLYGFVHQPHVLPAFLTVRIFSLELIRKRITV